jgi:hypothetical protein
MGVMSRRDYGWLVLCWLLALLLGFFTGTVISATDVLRLRVTFIQEDSWSPHGVQFYQIKLGDGTRATLTVDGDTAFAREVQQRLNKPLILTLESPELER